MSAPKGRETAERQNTRCAHIVVSKNNRMGHRVQTVFSPKFRNHVSPSLVRCDVEKETAWVPVKMLVREYYCLFVWLNELITKWKRLSARRGRETAETSESRRVWGAGGWTNHFFSIVDKKVNLTTAQYRYRKLYATTTKIVEKLEPKTQITCWNEFVIIVGLSLEEIRMLKQETNEVVASREKHGEHVAFRDHFLNTFKFCLFRNDIHISESIRDCCEHKIGEHKGQLKLIIIIKCELSLNDTCRNL